jgi:hypothetical protein
MADPRSSQTRTPTGATTTTTTTTTTVAQSGRPTAGLSLPQIMGSALAAVTTAVAASSLGVAGTLIGAAVGSIITTLATTIYANSLSRAARLSRTLVIRRAIAPERPGGALPGMAEPDPAPGAEPGEKVVEYTTRSGGEPRRVDSLWSRVRWKPLALVAGLVFVAAMAVISITELALGHPLGNSKETGITVSNLGGTSPQPTRTPTPAGTRTATATSSVAPTPTESAGATPTVGPSASLTTTAPSGTQTSPGLQTTAPAGTATTSSAPAAPHPSPSR